MVPGGFRSTLAELTGVPTLLEYHHGFGFLLSEFPTF